jgi:hypothetical protein
MCATRKATQSHYHIGPGSLGLLLMLLLTLLILLQALEIKRLNAAIAGLRSELNKQEEALEDCRRCGWQHSSPYGAVGLWCCLLCAVWERGLLVLHGDLQWSGDCVRVCACGACGVWCCSTFAVFSQLTSGALATAASAHLCLVVVHFVLCCA